MTCITNKLEDVFCLFCKKADHVYIGHGDVRFCAHCTMSWDPSEDGTLAKSVVFSDSATDGELPEDIVSRMGVLSGQILASLDFEARLRKILVLPEDIFLKHNRVDDHDEILGAGMPDGETLCRPDGPLLGETVEFGVTIKRDGEEVDISDFQEQE